MKEITGSIFDVTDADAICVTTNGVVKANGELVMGAGIAKQFAIRYPWLARELGKAVLEQGNHVHVFEQEGNNMHIVSFPTKHNWKDDAEIGLIIQSAEELVSWANSMEWKKIVLPPPGCGLGGLNWFSVEPILEPILDDRFYIITPHQKAINSFKGQYSFLSNMEQCPLRAWDMEFSCAEALYQAAKCANKEDRHRFVGLDGYEAKRLGKRVKLRENWHEIKISTMEKILLAKFTQEPFKTALMATGQIPLIEGNSWHDNFWGACTCYKCYPKEKQNILGRLLMEIRESLQEEN